MHLHVLIHQKLIQGTDYTINSNSTGGLTLFQTSSAIEENETFRLIDGVLGTFYRPDDVDGDQPWNATTPASNGYLTFSNQSVAHAGFDLGSSHSCQSYQITPLTT